MTASVFVVGLNGATASSVVLGAAGGSADELRMGSVLASFPESIAGNLLAESDMRFTGWDLNTRGVVEVGREYRILPAAVLERAAPLVGGATPWPAVVSAYDVDEYARPWAVGAIASEVARLREEIREYASATPEGSRIVVYLAAPLKQADMAMSSMSLADLEHSFEVDDPRISSSLVYAYAALQERCAFIDFTPNITLEVPGILELASRQQVPVAGRDGNTGQTLMKSVLGEVLRSRNLRLKGWYSTNILGNNDGLILSRPEHTQLKYDDKRDVLAPILGYNDFEHVINIAFYGPRGDNKEAWDVVDFNGWLDLPMSFRLNWQGRDSILAAPLVLDLIKHMDYCVRTGRTGLQSHLGLYFKRPLGLGWRPFSEAYRNLLDFYTQEESTR